MTTLALAAVLLASPSAGAGLPWIHDDLAGAMAEGGRRHLPVVVDIWTPW